MLPSARATSVCGSLTSIIRPAWSYWVVVVLPLASVLLTAWPQRSRVWLSTGVMVWVAALTTEVWVTTPLPATENAPPTFM